MLKQKRHLFELLFVGADILVVSAAWCFAYWLRFETEFIPVDKGRPPFSNYFSMLLFIWVIWAFVFRRMGLYRPMRGVRRVRELWTLVQANLFALLLLISVTYLFREKTMEFSRLVFLYFGASAIVFTVVERTVLRGLLREIRRQGYNLRYMLIIGAGQLAGDIATRIRLRRELGIQLIGCLAKDGTEKKGPRGVPIVGRYDDVAEILRTRDIDQVMVALPLEDSHLLPGIMAQIGDSLVDIKFVPDLYHFVSVGGAIDLVTKRILDLALASIIGVVIAPFLAGIALAVRLTSRGPIFYRQERVSFDGTPFTILKFRTMYSDAEQHGPGWTTKGDARITPLGRFLRSWSLDELPQLFNVLRGDMSIVGPRPERPVFIEEFRQRIPRYMLRHKVPAGMTGWAQVNGWRGDTSIDKRLEFDLYYIENWSLGLDLKILFLTLFRGFRDRNAY
jgi:lipopolysaccharide/colanic/teichoic acid biosynthesis glycosyltransferase